MRTRDKVKKNFENLNIAVSVDDIIGNGASMHAVDEVALPRYPLGTSYHRHLCVTNCQFLQKDKKQEYKLTKASSMKVVSL